MDLILFICCEDELKWLGKVPRLGFMMSEEELLLGQVSLALLGLSNASYETSLRPGRSSAGPEFGIAHHFWAGPHNYIRLFSFVTLINIFFSRKFMCNAKSENYIC